MAGLFYLPRLLVYLREAHDQPEAARSVLAPALALYARRLYKIIMQPALVITFAAGFAMIALYGWEWFALQTWLQAKLVLLLALVGFHLACWRLLMRLESGDIAYWSSMRLRLFNELPTVLLLAIVLLAVFRHGLNWLYALGVLAVFVLLLILGVRLYKRLRGV